MSFELDLVKVKLQKNAQLELHHAQILSVNNGGLLVPLKVVAKIFNIKTQSIYNKIVRGAFQFEIIKDGSRGYVRSRDLAEFLTFGRVVNFSTTHSQNVLTELTQSQAQKRGRGRPKKGELVNSRSGL
ncbi:hypothetical protein ACO0LB_09255 [Undibacterium sp. SXout7W]|uniref:hypothetical protein n=1 Tax=Undibacterium sp. SXout7W TaxID=3413049 RepID=UPI003BF0995B